MNTADKSELPSQAITAFTWLSKKHVVLRYPAGRWHISCWLISDTFPRAVSSVGLIGSCTCWNSSFGFLAGAHNRRFPPNSTAYTSPLKEDGLWCGCLRVIPLAPQSLSFHIVHHVFIHVRLFETCQAPLSTEFPRQEYWSGLPFPTPGDLPTQRWIQHILGLLH